MFNLLPSRNCGVEQFVEPGTVVMVFQMAEFMGYNIINTLFGSFHQISVEGHHALFR